MIKLLFLYLSLTLSPLFAEEKGCPTRIITEMVDGKEIEVEEFINLKLKKRKNRKGKEVLGTSRQHLFGSTDKGVIGLDMNSHTYDSIYDGRHDGHHLGKGEARLKTTMVDQGRLIVFKELSDAQKQGLYERIKSQAAQKYLFQTSCIRSTCTNIEKGTGIKLKGGKPWLPSKIFKRIIHEGFVDKDGNPVEVIYYSVEGKGFQQTLDRLQVREQEILTKVAKWAGGAAVVGATVVVVGGEVIELIFTKDDEI